MTIAERAEQILKMVLGTQWREQSGHCRFEVEQELLAERKRAAKIACPYTPQEVNAGLMKGGSVNAMSLRDWIARQIVSDEPVE